MNLVFMPMFVQGMKGMLRRMADGGANYSEARVPGAIDALPAYVMDLHHWILIAAVCLGIAQIPFIINIFWSMKHGEKVGDNPWEATTIDWQTPTPPPHGNFTHPVQVYRGPYEYSVPGHATDFTPQNEPEVTTTAPRTVPSHAY
jgi:cytochrome c oxidase subunit 1